MAFELLTGLYPSELKLFRRVFKTAVNFTLFLHNLKFTSKKKSGRENIEKHTHMS